MNESTYLRIPVRNVSYFRYLEALTNLRAAGFTKFEFEKT